MLHTLYTSTNMQSYHTYEHTETAVYSSGHTNKHGVIKLAGPAVW